MKFIWFWVQQVRPEFQVVEFQVQGVTELMRITRPVARGHEVAPKCNFIRFYLTLVSYLQRSVDFLFICPMCRRRVIAVERLKLPIDAKGVDSRTLRTLRGFDVVAWSERRLCNWSLGIHACKVPVEYVNMTSVGGTSRCSVATMCPCKASWMWSIICCLPSISLRSVERGWAPYTPFSLDRATDAIQLLNLSR